MRTLALIGDAPNEFGTRMSELKTAKESKIKFRHVALLIVFMLLVIAPAAFVVSYLYNQARDQFVSTVAFTVRSEDVSSASDLLGGLSALGSGSSSDTDILFEYIQSKTLVAAVDQRLNIKEKYSQFYEDDPWYSFDPEDTIEDLTEYWPQMVKIFYDQGTGLIEIKVRSFSRQDSKEIANAIYELSSELINRLNAIARDDAIAYAKDELNRAFERLRDTRSQLAEFRSLNKMVDPQAEIAMQSGVISSLQNQLSELLVEFDLILGTATEDDPRLVEIKQRIDVVKLRILEERDKFARESDSQISYSNLIGEFEGLMVDREYAEKTYLAALAAYDGAITEAQRQSRYLAPYIEPTPAEKSEYPQRALLSIFVLLGLTFLWLTIVLVYYAIKDRR